MTKNNIKTKIFAERLKQLMEENNETTRSIAEVVHLSNATISRYINNKMAPKITTIESLPRYFNVNPAWLSGFDVPKKLDSNDQSENLSDEISILAAHLEGEELTEEEMEDLTNYIDYIISKRDKK